MQFNTQNGKRKPWKIALEDALTVGALTLFTGLIAKGYPPTPEILYMTGLNAALTGLYGWVRARGIKHSSE